MLPVNWWNNGEFKDQLDTKTLQFPTLAEMFARDVAVPAAQQYVSTDGSIVLPAYRVFQQGPADFRARRFSPMLDTYGFVAGHVSPEAAVGGPIALIRDGDRITIDVTNRRIDVNVDLATRRAGFTPHVVRPARGVFAKYRASVASAAQGAVTIPNPPPAQVPASHKSAAAQDA